MLSGTNTFTGGVTVTGGILQVSADANLGAAGPLMMTGTTVNYPTLATTATFTSARNIIMGPTMLLTPTAGTTLTLTGILSGGAAGGGLLVATPNLVTGGTVVLAGPIRSSVPRRSITRR